MPAGVNAFAPRLRSRRSVPQDAADWQLIDDQIGLNLLEFDKIQNYRHNPTVPVELIGNALFLPLTQSYAPHEVRLGHVLSRVRQIPRLLDQVKAYLSDADPIFISTAISENDGNIDLIQNEIAKEIPAGSPLQARIRPSRARSHRLAEKFLGVAQGRSRQAPVEAHLAPGQGILRPEIPAGDGNGRRAGRACSPTPSAS